MKKIILMLIIFPILLLELNAKPSKIKIAVSPFKNKNIKKSASLTITNLFRNELIKYKKFDILDRANMKRILKEMQFQQSGVTGSSGAVKIGKMLNVKYMIFGTLSKLNKKYIITAEMVDIESSKIVSAANRKFSDIDKSDVIIKSMVRQIVYNKKSDRIKLSDMKDPVKIEKRLFRKSCSQNTRYKKFKKLGFISSYDGIIEKPYTFLVCKTTKMPSGKEEIKVISNLLVSTVFREKYIYKTALKAYKENKKYKTYGYKIIPKKGNKRHIEFRIYQKKGKPAFLEIFIITLDKNWKAKTAKKLKIHYK